MDLSRFYKLYNQEININIKRALKEDKVHADLTTNLLFKNLKLKQHALANLVCKENCILAGMFVFKKVFKLLTPHLSLRTFYQDGEFVKKGTIVLSLNAPISAILRGERTGLNFIQRMSGVATLTHRFVRLLRYRNAKILHTRKTTPNFRLFEIAAVKIGGGDFHRFDLNSSIMIKDNHIDALGGIENAFSIVHSHKLRSDEKVKFETEIRSLKELRLLLKYNFGRVKIVMLDNFPQNEISKAIKMLKKHRIRVELSGGINLNNFSKIQQRGIDYYSIGMLTHGYKSIDFSLNILN